MTSRTAAGHIDKQSENCFYFTLAFHVYMPSLYLHTVATPISHGAMLLPSPGMLHPQAMAIPTSFLAGFKTSRQWAVFRNLAGIEADIT